MTITSVETGHSRQERILTLLRQVFERHRHRLRGYQIFLFGSRATGRAGERSDFDIGVIGERPLPLEDAIEVPPPLYQIDWVDLHRASDEV